MAAVLYEFSSLSFSSDCELKKVLPCSLDAFRDVYMIEVVCCIFLKGLQSIGVESV